MLKALVIGEFIQSSPRLECLIPVSQTVIERET